MTTSKTKLEKYIHDFFMRVDCVENVVSDSELESEYIFVKRAYVAELAHEITKCYFYDEFFPFEYTADVLSAKGQFDLMEVVPVSALIEKGQEIVDFIENDKKMCAENPERWSELDKQDWLKGSDYVVELILENLVTELSS